jgi:predicted Rossmann fold nucleotide-binding protein DprA/Smf involved in DNA uptake
MLVSDGSAHPVRSVLDLWRAMAEGVQGLDASTLRTCLDFPSGCEEVWQAMAHRSGPVPRATLASLPGMSEDGLSRQLFTLEVQGWIRRLPGRVYLRV